MTNLYVTDVVNIIVTDNMEAQTASASVWWRFNLVTILWILHYDS